MGAEAEAAGDVLTGSIVAGTLEGAAGAPSARGAGVAHGCLNCGAALTGAYCAACGQSTHTHRSLLSLGHDILHGVFHFEGKIWRTVPELLFFPGRLTRRYIDGERVKFVSPMALFLFTAFLMFAVFSFTGGALLNTGGSGGINPRVANLKLDQGVQIQSTDEALAQLRAQRAVTDLTPDQQAKLDEEISDLESARAVMEALAEGDWGKISELGKQNQEQAEPSQTPVKLGWPALERRFNEGLKQLNDNPNLLLYKLKTNGYKFSWALIPLSIPFLWLLFFWRRDIHLYDHAIFVTYSITFMMLLVVLLSTAATAGVGAGIWGTALVFAPPIHMYRQLRGAYGLSRFGAFVRLFFLLIATTMVLTIFSVLLLVMGVLG